MKGIITYFNEVKVELTKVTWPKRKDVINYLSLVLIISAIVSLYVGGVDYLLTKGFEYLLAR